MRAKLSGVGGRRETTLSMNASSDTSHVESQTSISFIVAPIARWSKGMGSLE